MYVAGRMGVDRYMAKELSPAAAAAAQEKANLKEEKKQFKKEQKEQKKEAKRRAAEIAKHEEDLGEDGGGGLVTFFATLLIVALWLAIAFVIIKLDIGGFGSSVLTPILKDVPVLNKVLPGSSMPGTAETDDGYGGYTSLEEAVAYIRQLELELERAQTSSNSKDTELDSLKAEVLRLQEFEQQWMEFQRIKDEFYEEVVYSEKGPGLEAFITWFETMDPATAESIFRQVTVQRQEDTAFLEYAETFSTMKSKTAAAVLEEMVSSNNIDLAVRVLNALSVEKRAEIMNSISAEVAARLLKLMDPGA